MRGERSLRGLMLPPREVEETRRIALFAVLLLVMALQAPPASAERTVFFGAHPGGTDDGRLAAMTTLESLIDRELDFVRVFELWDSPFPTSFHDAVIASDRKMLLSVRAKRLNGSYVPWRGIADAQPGSAVYTQMVAWVERIRAIGEPVWFTFNHEPEFVENTANGVDRDFIDAWRRVIGEFRTRGVTNVEFVWIMTDWSFHVPASDRRYAPKWYPGDGYVDHIAADAYNWSTCRGSLTTPWHPLEWIIAPLRDFGREHPDKGLMLAEWASTTQGGDKAAWITEAGELLKQPGWEQFIAVSYFSRPDPSNPACNFPIDSSPSVRAAFAAMGADPFYGGAGLPPPPPSTIFSGNVDATNAIAPRWTSASYTPSAHGQHTLTLDWTGSADLRFEVRVESSNAWVGANTTTSRPKSLTVNLVAGTAYKVAVWSVSGSAAFTVTSASATPVDRAPTVGLLAPAAGATVAGTVTITASASDDVGVVSVAFTVDGIVVGTDTDGGNGWSAPWDSTIASDGPRVLGAIATDTSGQTGAAAARSVTVANSGPAVVFSSTVDASNTTFPRWVATTFTASVTGSHTFVLDWSGSANLRIDVRVAATKVWVGANASTAHPKSLTVNLTAGTAYQIAVWSVSGAAPFTVTA
jgi:hypothetical protein